MERSKSWPPLRIWSCSWSWSPDWPFKLRIFGLVWELRLWFFQLRTSYSLTRHWDMLGHLHLDITVKCACNCSFSFLNFPPPALTQQYADCSRRWFVAWIKADEKLSLRSVREAWIDLKGLIEIVQDGRAIVRITDSQESFSRPKPRWAGDKMQRTPSDRSKGQVGQRR